MSTAISTLGDDELWKLAHSVAESRSPYFDVSAIPELLGVALTVEMVQGIVDNGGVEYLLGLDLPRGLDYADVVRSFKLIDSWLCAEALQETFRAFPGGMPSAASDERATALSQILATRRELLDRVSRVFWDASESNYAAALKLLRAHPEVLNSTT